MKYWAYQNFKNCSPPRIRIHSEACKHKPGELEEGPLTLGYGRIWHGPYASLNDAIVFAKRSNEIFSLCRFCLKGNVDIDSDASSK